MSMNKMPLLSEYTECLLLVDYLETLKTQGKIILFTHVPNETFTKSWSIKTKNKRMGVRRGFPDYVIVFKKNKRIIFIEMKALKGKLSVEQEEWRQALDFAYVCFGFDEAKKVIDIYL